jgi:cytochrome c-type biogenesis protein CcmH
MTPIFLATAAVMLMVALSLALWLPQRRHNASMKRLRDAAEKLRALNRAHHAASLAVETEKASALPAAIDEILLATIDIDRTCRRPAIHATVVLIVLIPLAAMAAVRGAGSPHAEHLGAAHASVGSGTAPPLNHGADMQAAISKLSDKLRQYPDDAEGWALLGRTYKAMQQYAQAREAFRRAVAAAPDDTALAQEYAAAETPNPEPATTDRTMPQACAVAAADASSECDDSAQGAAQLTMKVALGPKFQDQRIANRIANGARSARWQPSAAPDPRMSR